MQEWLRYIVEHNIPVYNVYMQCYYIGNVGRKMIIMDRTRRLRMNATLRDMVRENHVRVDELIYPVFVTEENDVIQEVPSIIMADVCLCEYTSHGHCGLVKDGVILNDETLPLLAKASVAYAKAGADIIAPSDMMDKRVEAIRNALDEAGLVNVHTVPNLHQDITDRSGMPHIQHRDLVTERHIRWTRLMEKKR